MPFWQHKTLAEMNQEEWESLCDGCGQCCLNKLIDADTDEIYYTNVACDQLDLTTCQCKNYDNRFDYEPDCIKLTRENLLTIPWLPETCAYRRVHEQKTLPEWHPLIAGSTQLMHQSGASVHNFAVYEIDVIDWEDHILNKPK